MVVCVGAASVFQDVRVLRLDAVAAAIVDAGHVACTVDEFAGAAARAIDAPVDGVDELVEGLRAARVLERVEP